MAQKKGRTRKKGRIKKTISEWDFFWEDHQGLLAPPAAWNYSRVELLHVAIALQNFEIAEILRDLNLLRQYFKNTYGIGWNGNLSALIRVIQQHPEAVLEIKKTTFDAACKYLMITYNKLFGIKVPKGNLLAHKYVYQAYHETHERRKETSLICKFVLTKFLLGVKSDPSGLLRINTRSEILAIENRSSITAMWLCAIQVHKVIDDNFSEFIWDYNYNNLPFIVKPSSLKNEIRIFKKNKMDQWKQKVSSKYEQLKKINLFNFFSLPVAEVFMGFIGRQQYLMEKIIEQEKRHEGEIAESTLRLLYENRLKFLWLIKKQDIEAFKQYREYKVGREKLFLNYFKDAIKDLEQLKNAYSDMEKQFEHTMRSENVEDYRVAVERGDAFENNIKQMADDIGGNEPMYYFSIYKRASDIIHGNWRILERYHLEQSLNPAHDGLLRYSSDRNKFAGLLPSFLALLLSIDMLIEVFDTHTDLTKGNKRLYNSLKTMYETFKKKYYEYFMNSENLDHEQ